MTVHESWEYTLPDQYQEAMKLPNRFKALPTATESVVRCSKLAWVTTAIRTTDLPRQSLGFGVGLDDDGEMVVSLFDAARGVPERTL